LSNKTKAKKGGGGRAASNGEAIWGIRVGGAV